MNLIRIFFKPAWVFRNIASRWEWLVPGVASVVIALASFWFTIHAAGWEAPVRQMMIAHPDVAAVQNEAQIEGLLQQASTPAFQAFMYARVIVFEAGTILAVALLARWVITLLGWSAPASTCLAVTAYGVFAYEAVRGAAGAIAVRLAPQASAIDVASPFRLDATLLLDASTTPRALYALAGSFPWLWLLAAVFIAFGLSTAIRKLPYSHSLAVVGVAVGFYGTLGWLITLIF